MALATDVLKLELKEDILEILNTPITEESSNAEVKNNFATKLANVIGDRLDAWIKTGTVTVLPGIPVSTAGSSTAQTGATTGSGTGTIS